MRKTIPFVVTIVVSVLCTASLVRAAASSTETPVQESALAPSELLGSGLNLASCNTSPDNATEWTRFARCMTGNMAKVEKWGKTLDTCMKVFKVRARADDVYGDPGDPATFQQGQGLTFAQLAEDFDYFVGWKEQTACPLG